jgi:hypothetical protein
MPSRRRPVALALALALAACAASAAYAQRFLFRQQLPYATEDAFDGTFHFCRAVYPANPYGDGGGWTTDYPDADRNLSIRLSELTRTTVAMDPVTNDPNFLIVELTSPLLYKCPFIMMFEVGTFDVTDEQAARLREYLLKGGFLWVDDFWGQYAWDIWESGIRKVLPETVTYPIVDIPLDHPMFHTVFPMDHFPQIPSINYYLSTGDTSERGAASRPAHVRGIFAKDGRLLVLMTHNTDFGDSWERERLSHDYFLRFSVDGYAFGVDALVYAMTH